MTVFIITLVIVGVLLLINKCKVTSTPYQSNKQSINKSTTIDINAEGSHLYKKRGVKEFEIVGIKYRRINLDQNGDFEGYVCVEENEHDPYAVAVYNSLNIKLGYVPAGSTRLYYSLKKWHGGKTYAYGTLRGWEYEGKNFWEGCVFVPLGIEQKTSNSIL